MRANPERMVLEAIAAALTPPPIDYLAFAVEHIVLDGPFAGPYNRALFPFFDEILRALGPEDPCRYVTLMSSAQCGKTTIAGTFTLGAVNLGPRGVFGRASDRGFGAEMVAHEAVDIDAVDGNCARDVSATLSRHSGRRFL
jgi:hypothetical protein